MTLNGPSDEFAAFCQVDIQDHASGWTPLMRCAAMSGNAEISQLLLNAGASVVMVDK